MPKTGMSLASCRGGRIGVWQRRKPPVARCLAVPSDLSRTYAVVGRQDDQVRGAFDLRQPQPYRLGYGYVLAHRWWGQGLMTEALGEVVRWALDREDIWRIGDVCEVENLASARVMEKAGMTREGLLRRWIICQRRAPQLLQLRQSQVSSDLRRSRMSGRCSRPQ
jgi:RimJ/RimL family protein N-acetyltransferase